MRVLVVEDEAMTAMFLNMLLSEMGCTITGSVAKIEQALRLAQTAEIDFAILDLNLSGESSKPVADMLRQRGIPFALTTGSDMRDLPADMGCATTLMKPYSEAELRQVIDQLRRLSRAPAGPRPETMEGAPARLLSQKQGRKRPLK